MRAVPIEKDEAMLHEHMQHVVILPPDGDMLNEDILPVDALVGEEYGFSMKIVFAPGELEEIAAQDNPHFWLHILAARLVPFGFTVGGGW